MSKKNSSKELLGVYRRCLNALNQDFKVRTLDAQEIKSMVEKATKEAAEKQFSGKEADKERKRWINARVEELRSSKLANHFRDPRAAAKEQIKALMSKLG